MRMMTTRTWPIPWLGYTNVQNDIPFTIGSYGPPTDILQNNTDLRLCSVDLSIVLATDAPDDVSIEVVVGIGNPRLVSAATFIQSVSIPRLDPFHAALANHRTMQRCTGIAGEVGCEYTPRTGSPVLIEGERPVIGVVRKRRPLRYRWQKAARPEMQLYSNTAAPCIWGIPHWANTGLHAIWLVGMVTFECEK